MVEIASYLRVGRRFIEITAFEGQMTDPQYIEGAIELTLNSTQLISMEMWDLVDQLWCYFIAGMESLLSERDYATFFPDQPIQIKMERLQLGTVVRVEIIVAPNRSRSATGDYAEFMHGLVRSARVFFTAMNLIVPGTPYNAEPARLKTIETQLIDD